MNLKALGKWAGALIITSSPALVAGAFSYMKAQSEADAGYKTLLAAVAATEKELRELHDRIVVLEVRASRPQPKMAKPETWPLVSPPAADNVDDAMNPKPAAKHEYRPRVLPADLAGAAMEQRQMEAK